MLPPSPPVYNTRFTPNHFVSNDHTPNAVREPVPPAPPQPRPSSSMSISSMLGSSEVDRAPRETNLAIAPHPISPYQPKLSHSTSDMSPPLQTPRSDASETLKPRSQSPGRMGISNLLGTRSHRSGSGSIFQGPRPDGDSWGSFSQPVFSPTRDTFTPSLPRAPVYRNNDHSSHQRRTSIPGLLQKPSDQAHHPPPPPPPPPPLPSKSDKTAPGESTQSPSSSKTGYETWLTHAKTPARTSEHPSGPLPPIPSPASEYEGSRQPRYQPNSAVPLTQYDVRPPGFGENSHQLPTAPHSRNSDPPPSPWEERPSKSLSPHSRRQIPGQSQFRTSNGPAGTAPSPAAAQVVENSHPRSTLMSRQDSSQSQVERTILGERLDKTRARVFSPFVHSHASQTLQPGSATTEEKSRKGSDELSQHRALLGLAAEGKKGGRYSPLPQVVQGAQAQSVVPDFGIKTEQGKIFSGIGSGVSATSASPVPGPPGLAASPFKRDENGARSAQEDHLMRMSRSSSGFGKRARDVKREDGKAASENESIDRVRKKPRNALLVSSFLPFCRVLKLTEF